MSEALRRGGYRVMVDGKERAQISARHWGEASASLYVRMSDDDEWGVTPFQVADARHDSGRAVLLIDKWLEDQGGDGFLALGEEFELVDLKDDEEISA